MQVEGERVGHTFKTNLKYKLHHRFGEQFGDFYQSSTKVWSLWAKSFHFQKLSQGHKHLSQNVFTKIFTAPLLIVNQVSNRGEKWVNYGISPTTGSNFPWMPFSPPPFSIFFTKSASQSPHWLSQWADPSPGNLRGNLVGTHGKCPPPWQNWGENRNSFPYF